MRLICPANPTVPAPRVEEALVPSVEPDSLVLSVQTNIHVFAGERDEASITEGVDKVITPEEIETSAGTFGDLSRFLQTMAGVAGGNDQRNDFLVRGGNPSENSFVIDNIEIPSINQLALSDSSGGFVSMLDSAAIQRVDLHTDSYDSKFDQRLSSVVEVSTRPSESVSKHMISEVGIAGAGSSITEPFGKKGSLFVSGRQSVLQYVTNDIGMNGVPKYRNFFVRAENNINDNNSWWGMSLTGIDSMLITPSITDNQETSPYAVDYHGSRNTTGLNWQHNFSASSFGVASIANAYQGQTILENAQLQHNALIYNEATSDSISTGKYDFTTQFNKRITVTAGGRASLDSLNYAVAQPIGLQNPYSSDPAPLNATSMASKFSTFSSAAYLQMAIALPHRSELVLGERAMQWALGGHAGTTSKVLFSTPIIGGRLIHVGYSEYEQQPSTLYLLSFNNLSTLRPIHDRQVSAGVNLIDSRNAKLSVEVYNKLYSDYPVAANYPQLSLANVTDTFGEAFLMFPMVGTGKGTARGVELTARTRPTSRLSVSGTLTYARDWYSGLDGILRKGNYDIPLSANLTGEWAVGRGYLISARYTMTSGRPYTPDILAESQEQRRDVYNLNMINAVRSSAYERLDFRVERLIKVSRGTLTWHAGLQNALDHKNFYSLLWEPQSKPGTQSEQDQMPIFPDGGIKYAF